jgi:hypothetical protein
LRGHAQRGGQAVGHRARPRPVCVRR